MRDFVQAVEALDNQVAAEVQLKLLIESRRLVERATRWLVSAASGSIDIAATVQRYAAGAEQLDRAMPGMLTGDDLDSYESRLADLQAAGVPEELAGRVAYMPALLSVLDIVEVAEATGRPLEQVTETYFTLGARLELDWLRDRIIELPRANRWQALARQALRDDLLSLHHSLAQEVLESAGAADRAAIDAWLEQNESAVGRCLGVIADIKASRIHDTTTLPVALREVRHLIRGGSGGAPAPNVEPVAAD
jgi:glutamate dehydrogenase